MEKIKIKRLGELIAFEEYIKGQQPLVACVYCSSIYFYDATGEHCQNSIQWNLKDDNSKELNKALLAAINAACNTNFELNENGSD